MAWDTNPSPELYLMLQYCHTNTTTLHMSLVPTVCVCMCRWPCRLSNLFFSKHTCMASLCHILFPSWQPPSIPEGVTSIRFRVDRDAEASPSQPLFVYASPQDLAISYSVTFVDLNHDTVYHFRVRTDVRYEYCSSYLYGNYSDSITASPSPTDEPGTCVV